MIDCLSVEPGCLPACRTNTQRVNSGWCHRCTVEMRRRAETESIPFCACGRRVSDCDGSRAGCGKRARCGMSRDHCPVCDERPAEPAFSGCCTVQCERAMYAEREELDRLRAAAPEVSRCAD